MEEPIQPNNETASKNKTKHKKNITSPSRKLNFTPRYFSRKITEAEWTKMKCAELKQTCIRFGLKVSGTKLQLIERIRAHLAKEQSIIKIQKIFRGFVAREIVRLKGPGYRSHKICVNDCDFYSLDPLDEIPDCQFFSYRVSAGFVYAFDLFSLMTMYVKNRQIVNPYNRKEVDFPVICDIFSLYMKTLIYYPQSELASLGKKKIKLSRAQEDATATQQPEVPRIVLAGEILRELRTGRTIRERIVQAFMEIDNLGNYTDHRWFSELTTEQYLYFYRNYFVFWTGNQIPLNIRSKICAAGNPFSTMNREDIQMKCVELIEWMVYTGIDREHRTLGALHVLSMLTTVSVRARQSLPWLSV